MSCWGDLAKFLPMWIWTGNISKEDILFIIKQNKQEWRNQYQCSKNNFCMKLESMNTLYRFQLFQCNKIGLLRRIKESCLRWHCWISPEIPRCLHVEEMTGNKSKLNQLAHFSLLSLLPRNHAGHWDMDRLLHWRVLVILLMRLSNHY